MGRRSRGKACRRGGGGGLTPDRGVRRQKPPPPCRPGRRPTRGRHNTRADAGPTARWFGRQTRHDRLAHGPEGLLSVARAVGGGRGAVAWYRPRSPRRRGLVPTPKPRLQRCCGCRLLPPGGATPRFWTPTTPPPQLTVGRRPLGGWGGVLEGGFREGGLGGGSRRGLEGGGSGRVRGSWRPRTRGVAPPPPPGCSPTGFPTAARPSPPHACAGLPSPPPAPNRRTGSRIPLPLRT